MVDTRKLPQGSKPLSNCEVNKIISNYYAGNRHDDIHSGLAGLNLNEQGNELRKQTLEYIQEYNEFELGASIQDIRK